MNAVNPETFSAHECVEFPRGNQNGVQATTPLEIAVVGASCRFPGGVDSLDAFWDLLISGRDPIGPIPESRWNHPEVFDASPESSGKTYAFEGGFIEDVADFDPAFFDISPREAAEMDPQQRLLLELSWEVFCHAGIDIAKMKGSATGVFVGMSTDDYAGLTVHNGNHASIDAYNSLGTARSVAAGRIAYTWGFHGPVIQMDTACSSSLAAIHLACQSIAGGDCEQALVAGINLMLSPGMHIACSRLRALSPNSRCKVFDEGADGYVRSEGAGCVLVKPLHQAEQDGNRILGVIKSCAINHDGKSNGLTAPNGRAQVQLIRRALTRAGLAAHQVGYVEMHGTGTRLGDPIEVHSLCEALGRRGKKSKTRPLLMGSVKSNIGHAEAAAGMASLLKAILIQQKGKIPANLHFNTPNQQIRWAQLDAQVVNESVAWPQSSLSPLIGVSGFGLSGTNVHLVVGASPQSGLPKKIYGESENLPCILPISGRDDVALKSQLLNCQQLLNEMNDRDFSDWCAAHALHGTHFSNRKTFVANSPGEMKSLVDQVLTLPELQRSEHSDHVCFVFTGQGAQYAGMGRELAERVPRFRFYMNELKPQFERLMGVSLEELWWGERSTSLNQTQFTQPALFAFEYCLARTLMDWNIKPDLCLGHSVGEYVALCVAGMLHVEDALHFIVERAGCMAECKAAGLMVAVMAPSTVVEEIIAHSSEAHANKLSIAAYNSPCSTVISGAADAVTAVMNSLEAKGVRCILLDVSHAFHSPLMQSAANAFMKQLSLHYPAGLNVETPAVPVISNVCAALLEPMSLTPEYLAKHIVDPVRFSEGVACAVEMGANVFIEIGPKSTLLQLLRQILPEASIQAIAAISQPAQSTLSLYRCIGRLFDLGLSPDFSLISGKSRLQHVERMKYPLAPQRLWTLSTPKSRRGEADVTAMIYQIQWQPAGEMTSHPHASNWLLIEWEKGIGEPWISKLKEQGNRVECVRCAFEEPAVCMQNIADKFGRSDYKGILLPLAAEQGVSSKIYECTLRVIDLCRNLLVGTDKCTPSVPLWILESPKGKLRGMMSTTLEGFVKGASLERRRGWGGWITLSEFDDRSCKMLQQALGSENSDFLKIENGQFLQPVLMPALKTAQKQKWVQSPLNSMKFNEEDALLIAGGAGGLGLAMLKWCIERGLRRALVIGRRSFDALGASAKNLEEISRSGVTLFYREVDISNACRLYEVVEEFEADVGPLTGFIHAAGVASHLKLEHWAEDSLSATLASKYWGAWHMHQLSVARGTRIFLMCSSISSLWGSADLAHYSAANACLDAIAEYRLQQNMPVHCIQWGPWSEAGMAKDKVSQEMEKIGIKGLDNITAHKLFSRVIDGESGIYAAVNADWNRVQSAFSFSPRSRFFDSLADKPIASPSEPTAVEIRNALVALEGDSLLEHVRLRVLDALSQKLALDKAKIVMDMPLRDLGVDSLLAVDIGKSLENWVGESLPATLLFDSPTPRALVADLILRIENMRKSIAAVTAKTREPNVVMSSLPLMDIIRQVRELDENALELLLSA